MNIKETFIRLTSETYPHGHEEGVICLLPKDLKKDEFGNLFKEIGESPSTMFTSHLDTASHDKVKVNHVFEGNIIKTDGTSILGADDKAGVTIMLYMMEKGVPGLYYFFLGEERGCIGSKKVAEKHRTNSLPYIKKVVSFDRRGNNSIITHQSSLRCCSDSFGNALSDQLNRKSKALSYSLDPTGIYTDSYQFTGIYPECTNISVGYMYEHTKNEKQDISHLEELTKTLVLVDWESLPVERDPSKPEYDYKNSWEYPYQSYTFKKKTETKRVWFIDSDYDKHVSLVEMNSSTQDVINIDFCKKRISDETEMIQEFLMTLDIGIYSLEWDGVCLTVEHKVSYGGHQTKVSRKELSEFLPELNFWKIFIK